MKTGLGPIGVDKSYMGDLGGGGGSGTGSGSGSDGGNGSGSGLGSGGGDQLDSNPGSYRAMTRTTITGFGPVVTWMTGPQTRYYTYTGSNLDIPRVATVTVRAASWVTTDAPWTSTIFPTRFEYFTRRRRALDTAAPQPVATRRDGEGRASSAAPTHAPTPTAASVVKERAPTPEMEAAPLARRQYGVSLDDLREAAESGGSAGYVGSVTMEAEVEAAFLNKVPNFLGLFWSAAVLIWLGILPCCSAKSRAKAAPRSLDSMEKTTLGFWISGLILSLYTVVVVGYNAGMSSYYTATGLSVCIIVFIWLTTIVLFSVWLWLRRWGRKHAKGQLHRSMEAVEDEDAGIASPGSDPALESKVDAADMPLKLPYGANEAHSGAFPSTSSTPVTEQYAQPQYAQPAQSALPAQPTQPAYGQTQFPYAPPTSQAPVAPAGYTYQLVPTGSAGAPSAGAPSMGAPSVVAPSVDAHSASSPSPPPKDYYSGMHQQHGAPVSPGPPSPVQQYHPAPASPEQYHLPQGQQMAPGQHFQQTHQGYHGYPEQHQPGQPMYQPQPVQPQQNFHQ